MRPARSAARALAPLLLLTLARCAKDPTGVFVTLRNEVPAAQAFFLQTYKGDDENSLMRPTDVEGPVTLPAGGSRTFVILDVNHYSRIGIQVLGAQRSSMMPPQGAEVVAYDRAIVDLRADQMLAVSMTLRAPCRGRLGQILMGPLCPPTEHCTERGECDSALRANPARHEW